MAEEHYLKINKYEYLNCAKIEAVCLYERSRPLRAVLKKAEEDGLLEKMQLSHKVKSVIFYDDGRAFLCPYSPETYMKKLDASEYAAASPKKFYFRRSMILTATMRLTAGQRRDYLSKKEEGRYVKLSGSRKTNWYVFTDGGRIYGLASFKDIV